jgi:hypothetical protein
VGKIRNSFARDIGADFSDSRISQWRRALQWHKDFFFADPPPEAAGRDLFQVGVNQLVTYLEDRRPASRLAYAASGR